MRKIAVLLPLLFLLGGCGLVSSQPSSTTTSQSTPTTRSDLGTTSASDNNIRDIVTEKGYAPTREDVNNYNNDLPTFLSAKVPGYSRYHKALIIVDGKEADSLSGISLGSVKNIAVLEPSAATRNYGSKGGYGVIEIKTK